MRKQKHYVNNHIERNKKAEWKKRGMYVEQISGNECYQEEYLSIVIGS